MLPDLVKGIGREIQIKGANFTNKITSLYFGGGTPSLLEIDQLAKIMEQIHDHFDLESDIEISLEANPEDISRSYLSGLKSLGINRLSLGIQSFDDGDLAFVNRGHSAQQAVNAIRTIQNSEIDAYSIDLIFGLIGSTFDTWKKNLDTVSEMDIPHVSCYNLTIEEQTVFANWLQKKLIIQSDDEYQLNQFLYTHNFLTDLGYDHYEISNYAKTGFFAVHNSNYWNGAPYIGIGPSAHSYYNEKRVWNVSNNALYIKQVSEGQQFWEEEDLTESDRYNEAIMLGLRTRKGLSKALLQSFSERVKDHFKSVSQTLLTEGLLDDSLTHYFIPIKKIFLCDSICSDLFLIS